MTQDPSLDSDAIDNGMAMSNQLADPSGQQRIPFPTPKPMSNVRIMTDGRGSNTTKIVMEDGTMITGIRSMRVDARAHELPVLTLEIVGFATMSADELKNKSWDEYTDELETSEAED